MLRSDRAKRIALAVLGVAAAILFGRLATVALTQGDRSAAERRNIGTAVAFYRAAISERDFERARGYIGERYVQHGTADAEGSEALRALIEQRTASAAELPHALADGDYVVLHSELASAAGTPGGATVDILRFDAAGAIVEHWTFAQHP